MMSEINDIEELPEAFFPINLKLIDQHQWRYPIQMDKYTIGVYKTGYFCGGSNIGLKLITCMDKILFR